MMSLKQKYDANNPANRVRPGLRFVYSHPAYMIALFFGAGCLRPAPGTWGTAAGVLSWVGLVQFMPWQALSAMIAAMFILGALACEKTGRDLGVEDAGCIVIDEVVAVWLLCLFLPQTPIAWTAAFIAFRVFDIVKLPPASTIDSHMKNGWGVMLDDILAAVWAFGVIVLIDMVINRFEPQGWWFLGLF